MIPLNKASAGEDATVIVKTLTGKTIELGVNTANDTVADLKD